MIDQPAPTLDFDAYRASLPANRIELCAMTTPHGEWLFTVGCALNGEVQLLSYCGEDYSEAILFAGKLERELGLPVFDFIQGQSTWGAHG